MEGQNLTIGLDSQACASIDDYVEYRRIVGDDDGGTLFTPKEYEDYKRKVLPMRLKNRLFVSWSSPSGIECKMVGPETLCFCQHRYKQHKTDFKQLPKASPIKTPCEATGCPCSSFSYVPRNGSRPIRCQCKHFSSDHKAKAPHQCLERCQCSRFHSSYTCGCGEPTYTHYMITETREQRAARGRPVGHDVPYKAMGGLTGFSSLAEGYMRLDDSGIGAPGRQFLEQDIGSDDHPFLKMYENMGQLSISNEVKQRPRTEAEEMAFYEKRYQERLKKERELKRSAIQQSVTNKHSRPARKNP